MRLTLALGADHGGFTLKEELLPWLRGLGYQVQDIGAYSLDPDDDFPDYAHPVAQMVASGQAWRGLLICGSGVGACVAANKVPGVRACVCHDAYSARQGVEHDDMNILCLGARIVGVELARELVTAFLNARFNGQGKYQRRLDKVLAIESSFLKVERDQTHQETQ
ncbi:MAG: ribose 5-phosphate isomerase B [Dehalococcoidia bacterium]|nr:ribose 5-phosphate isomerase B [Chloroflexota bacterium]